MTDSKKILIADDSLTMIKLVTMVLTKEGYQVVVAHDGLQAINKIYNELPDLVISDVTMPGMNGYQVCRLVRDDPEISHIPFILLTAKDQKSDKFWGIKTGADDFITKPFNPDDLSTRVAKILKKSELAGNIAEIKPSRKPKTNEEIISRVNDLLDQRLYESTLLNEVASLSESMDNYQEVIEKVMEIIHRVIEYQSSLLYLLGDSSDEIYELSVRECNPVYVGNMLSISEKELQKLDTSIVLKEKKEYFHFNKKNIDPVMPNNDQLKDYICIPLKTRSQISGMWMIGESREECFTDSHRNFFKLIVNQAATVLDNARLYAQLKSFSEARERSLQIINQAGQMAASMTEIKNLTKMIINFAVEVTSAEAGSLILYDRERNDLYFAAAIGSNVEGLENVRINMGQGVAGIVAESLEPLIIKDAHFDSRFNKNVDKKTGFITKSILCIPLMTKGECLGVLEVINKKDDTIFCDADLELLSTLGTQISSAIDNANMYSQMKSLFLSTVQSLSSAIDAKNKYTNDHSRRVTIYTLAIAQEMGCTVEVCNNIRLSGLLHDIGKIGVPEAILDKTSRLTDVEFKKIKEHPMIGAKIMEPIKPLQKIIPGMRYHHERWDGRGYPDGLKGLEIPLAGRIIAVADTFDAMTSDRSYRKGLSSEIAIEEIKNCSGTQFDPIVVEAFLRAYDKTNIRVLK